MNLSDCEVAHRHVRGHNAIFIFGPRAVTAGECAALAAEYAANYGEMHKPAYCSPAGWQVLHAPPEPVADPVEVTADGNVVKPEPAAPTEVAAVVPPNASAEPPAEVHAKKTRAK